MSYVRLDDFPHGHRGVWNKAEHRVLVGKALRIFEEYRVPYILGISPLLLVPEDVSFLNSVLGVGEAGLHGFDHYFSYGPPDWESIAGTWARGGEFEGKSGEELEAKFAESLQICSTIRRFTSQHFIPPFNVFTQNLLTALHRSMPECRYVHTCDQEWNRYKQADLEYYGIAPVVARLGSGYDHVDKVLERVKNGTVQGQITLHWIFDTRRLSSSWEGYYRELCELLVKKGWVVDA